MFEYNGSCACGSVEFTLKLPKALSGYSPRQCDCNFCTSRGISYLSDPKGYLSLRHRESLMVHHQGSEQADFLSCRSCKVIVAVSIYIEDECLGALNASLLASSLMLPSTTVSPKLLAADEKIERWASVWLHLQL
ncbi:aldehyde-activating protein [Agaribacter marinus]|nr:aldehyde-activating protein [Agaribacter marinus]